jgi:serine/threonine protein kinase
VTGDPLPATADDSRIQDDAENQDDPRFQPGQTMLGHYTVVRQLGKGGMGTVYLARDEVSGQEVAVKVLPASLARERDIRDRFIQEARALASMDHTNIVPLITFAQENEDRFLVMKYIPGEPLDARIRRLGVLEPVDARKVLRALLSALGYAHARGVIHRDVKPSNLIIEGDINGEHRIFLVDFGIAKKEESSQKLTQTGMLMGTPQYMSPEQISGHSVDGRSDLYSAGLVLFEMLCGRPPFDGQKTFQVLRAHVEQPVPDMHEARGARVPDDLVAIAMLLLQKDPNDRPADANAAIALLDGTGSFPILKPHAPTPPTVSMPRPSSGSASGITPAASTGVTRSFAEPPTSAIEDPSLDEIRALRSNRAPRFLAALAFFGAVGAGAWYVTQHEGPLFPDPPPKVVDAGDEHDLVTDDVTLSLLLSKAKLNLEQKDIEGARVVVDAAIDQSPKSAKARVLRSQILVAGGLLEEAEKEIARARALTPDADQEAALVEIESAIAKVRADKEAAEREREEKERERRERERAARDRGLPPSRLSRDAKENITDKTAAAFGACYEKYVLKKKPKAEGKVDFEVIVLPEARIYDVKVKTQKALDLPGFSPCVREAARTWKFPKFSGKENDKFTHTIVFAPRK